MSLDFRNLHKKIESEATSSSVESLIENRIEELPSELRTRWQKRLDDASDTQLPPLLVELNEFMVRRNNALIHTMSSSFEGTRHRVTDSLVVQETIQKLKLIEGRDDLFISEGKTAHVFRDPDIPQICYKFVHNFYEYGAWNSIEKEGQFLEDLEDLEVDGARVPKVSKLIDLPDVKVIVMEYINGPSIDDMINRRGPVVEKFNMDIFMKKLRAYIHAMHEQKNIYHRDLHNGNVLVGPDSTPYIIDFGRSVRSIGSEYAYDYTDKTGQNRIVLTSDEDRLNNIRNTLQVYTHQIAPIA